MFLFLKFLFTHIENKYNVNKVLDLLNGHEYFYLFYLLPSEQKQSKL